MLSHYQHREKYAKELSSAIAEMVDRNVWRMLIKAAKIKDAATEKTHLKAGLESLKGQKYTKPVTIEENVAGKGATGRQLVQAIYRARTRLKVNHVPVQEAVAIVRPEHYELLVNAAQEAGNMAWLNKDYINSGNNVESGLPNGGMPLLRIAGIPIYETENFPFADESDKDKYPDDKPLAETDGGSGRTDRYYVDSSKTLMIVFTKDAIGTAKIKDLSIEHVPEPLRLGHNIITKMFVGHEILQHECACEIKVFEKGADDTDKDGLTPDIPKVTASAYAANEDVYTAPKTGCNKAA
ncbi:hypothetical protein H744_2c2982 [Photobacterium gaetbulicola Gung47]|uniref:Capsid Gp10A/Gp10B-like domain-containing protein n=2 Tax=Photobacterium gaetbulicola TaxID=1295392 RepID=A0A0C5WR49_9GAMM|nr:hypothetical protein H744_2c2982 [Photobacterium gaetbulicola Gung47]